MGVVSLNGNYRKKKLFINIYNIFVLYIFFYFSSGVTPCPCIDNGEAETYVISPSHLYKVHISTDCGNFIYITELIGTPPPMDTHN